MHSILHADLAALVSHHGPAILRGGRDVPGEAVARYWASTRNRFELWHRAMARYRNVASTGDMNSIRDWWQTHVVIIEEVFVSEILTRVIAALGEQIDQVNEGDELSPITHSVYLSHVEARNRVQKIMLNGRGNSVQDAVRLNRLRKGVERWIDVMVGRMSATSDHSLEYSVDKARASEFAVEMRGYGGGPSRDTAAWLMNAAMHDMLRLRMSSHAALPEANRAVASSVMLMLRPDLFDSVGTLKSLWLHRLQQGTRRADRVIEELIAPNIDDAETAAGLEMIHETYFERWYF